LNKTTADGRVTEEEIKAIIKEGEGGEVQEIEQDIVERVFHIGDRKINSMTQKSRLFFTALC
jgi:putative hemolysin